MINPAMLQAFKSRFVTGMQAYLLGHTKAGFTESRLDTEVLWDKFVELGVESLAERLVNAACLDWMPGSWECDEVFNPLWYRAGEDIATQYLGGDWQPVLVTSRVKPRARTISGEMQVFTLDSPIYDAIPDLLFMEAMSPYSHATGRLLSGDSIDAKLVPPGTYGYLSKNTGGGLYYFHGPLWPDCPTLDPVDALVGTTAQGVYR